MEHVPPGGAGDGGAAGAERSGRLGIGGVLRALREEFPDVTVSKIRFLETEGLVEPGRSPSGHRWFGHADVERLRDVLRMQRDHYLPLRVIKERLASAAAGERSSPGAKAPRWSSPGTRSERPSGPGAGASREELLAAADATEAELAEWESHGLLGPSADGSYDAGALTVARIASDLGRHGIRPQQIRSVKDAAEQHATMLTCGSAAPEGHRESRAASGAELPVARLAALSVRLYEVFVQAAAQVPPAQGPDRGSRESE